MATSADDVSELETAHNKVNALVDHSDGDTTAAATAPANRRKAGLPSPPDEPETVAAEDDDEDRTVQQPVDPKVRNESRNAALALGDKAARPPPPAPPLRITSKKMTAVGLGPVRPPEQTPQPTAPPVPPPTPMSASPPPATPNLAASSGAPTLKDPTKKTSSSSSSSGSSASSSPSKSSSSVPPVASQAEVADDSITATAPAPRISVNGTSLPITVPSIVKITELGDEPLDETEVRTVVTGATDDDGGVDSLEAALNAPTSSSPAPTDPAPTAPTPGKAKTLESAVPPPPTTEADEPDDSVTAQAPSPLSGGRLPEEDEPRTSPPMLAPKLATRPPIPAAGRRPEIPGPPPVPPTARTGPHASSADDDDDDQYEGDESVTTRGPAIADHEFADDSVTAQAPVTRSSPNGPVALATPPTFEETDGTTKRVPKGKNQVAKPGSPEELQSVTSEAPAGHLSNMLRVIANGSHSSNEDGDDSDSDSDSDPDSDDSAENRTAVMLNAPVKPPPAAGAPPPGVSSRPRFPAAIPTTGGGGRRTAAIADLRADFRESSSDSGLRIARAEAPSGDHASMNALLAGSPIEGQQGHRSEPHQRGSGVSEKNGNGDANPFAKTQQAFATPGPRSRSRSEQVSVRARSHDSPSDFAASIKKPRYGLIVAAVAVLSFAIPLILFLWLHSGSSELTPREKTEVNPDIVKPEPPRPKAPASARAAIAASASAAARKNDPLNKRH